MNRRFVAALIVALAVLFGQGGGLVLAAICPHLRSEEQPDNSCHSKSRGDVAGVAGVAEVAEVAKHHHQPAEAEPGDAFATEEHDVRCNHCVVHSRSKREESALQQPNTSQRAEDHKVAVPLLKLQPPSSLRSSAWQARAQGPPGPAAPLHVLLNVFRI
jgi:hypothetical protein